MFFTLDARELSVDVGGHFERRLSSANSILFKPPKRLKGTLDNYEHKLPKVPILEIN